MRGIPRWAIAGFIASTMATVTSSCTAQAPDTFRWIDFHSPADQDVVVWVTRALDNEKWTAIREIGVEYDAALVIATIRANPQAAPDRDTFSIWSISLSDRKLTHLVDGANLRLMDWLLLNVGQGGELSALYDDCNDCQATTYFTAFHYDLRQHTFAARWMQGGEAAPVWASNPALGVTQTQVFAVMADGNGRETLGTCNHLDYGKEKPAEETVYRYDIDPLSDGERTQLLSGRDAATMKDRLCRAEDAVPGLSRGQDSSVCQTSQKPHHERRPVTTPPANNQGQSRPPRAPR
ncbi:MAG: hypothetical protein WBQ95_04120 [Terracidiphilus sp.]